MNIEWIAAPIIGGLIGLVTNNIAIKMLFKPYKEVYIGKIRLPFTPGLIPKERPRIAKAIGNVIGNELLDPRTMQEALCSEKVHEIFSEKFRDIMDQYAANESSLGQYAEQKKWKQNIDSFEKKISHSAGIYVTKELLNRKISVQLVETAMEEITKHLNPLLMSMASGAINVAKEPLAQKIDDMIAEYCPSIVEEYIDIKYEEITQKQVKEIAMGIDERIPYLSDIIWNAYTSFIKEKSSGFLKAVNIAQVVEDKINEYDIQQFEKLILDIAKKELNAVVWLGGLLGMVMGFVNLLF